MKGKSLENDTNQRQQKENTEIPASKTFSGNQPMNEERHASHMKSAVTEARIQGMDCQSLDKDWVQLDITLKGIHMTMMEDRHEMTR